MWTVISGKGTVGGRECVHWRSTCTAGARRKSRFHNGTGALIWKTAAIFSVRTSWPCHCLRKHSIPPSVALGCWEAVNRLRSTCSPSGMVSQVAGSAR